MLFYQAVPAFCHHLTPSTAFSNIFILFSPWLPGPDTPPLSQELSRELWCGWPYSSHKSSSSSWPRAVPLLCPWSCLFSPFEEFFFLRVYYAIFSYPLPLVLVYCPIPTYYEHVQLSPTFVQGDILYSHLPLHHHTSDNLCIHVSGFCTYIYSSPYSSLKPMLDAVPFRLIPDIPPTFLGPVSFGIHSINSAIPYQFPSL